MNEKVMQMNILPPPILSSLSQSMLSLVKAIYTR